jgi:S-adenosylmethionine:tRNA ribosyltransferase-isomerase
MHTAHPRSFDLRQMVPQTHGPVARMSQRPTMPSMRADELDYNLPGELIATAAAQPRDSAKLMVVDRSTGRIEHRRVRDLPELGVFQQGDLMLVNRSKVLPAYYHGTRAATGGKITGLYLGSPNANQWLTLIESRGKLQPGERIDLDGDSHLILVESVGRGEWLAKYTGEDDTLTLLSRIGLAPLPPYIRKARKAHHQPEVTAEDMGRYNTVYADQLGSVAAPTAGLHFTTELLDVLEAAGVTRAEVTLHVGMGTFAPIRCDKVDDHPIHSEFITVPPETIRAIQRTRETGKSITAVGTKLFIVPNAGFTYRHTDHLLTNFHLPRSTLLALVAALPDVGIDQLMGWYHEAIREKYRFYSFGDAMLII